MKLAYDLHIHTALSPCADKDMTPNNIVNMSILKGLDVIAVTDHNSCKNVRACISCAKDRPLLVIPGMEVETAEEIHLLCLFPDAGKAEEMQEWVYSHLPHIRNNEGIFGEQLILDDDDNITGVEERLLLCPAAMTINEVYDVVQDRLEGAVIPAHIDRQSNSLLESFGVMPEDISITCVELSQKNQVCRLTGKHPSIRNMKTLFSSDAHYLGYISERENFLEADCKEVRAVLNSLKAGWKQEFK
ncbi:PHP domain protein [Ruminiclostridium hungatei]|uniref:PHP domain protein n=1 Tax=Ruminiclostridium hungatei TaxID=48256 RepID=A0A1V4SKV7_RUMHU|nr:PHP domain-containing protein [Ruminiclostridium hungatei]OPX44115.1 PHP domain protein [Ruminiclostridium hungatei]